MPLLIVSYFYDLLFHVGVQQINSLLYPTRVLGLANEAMDAQKSWMTIAEDLDDGDDDSSLGETRVFADV